MKKEKTNQKNEKMSYQEKVPIKNVLGTFLKPDENIEDHVEKYPERLEVIVSLKFARNEADNIVRPTTESGGNTTRTSRNNEKDGNFQKDIKNKAKSRTQKTEKIEQNI